MMTDRPGGSKSADRLFRGKINFCIFCTFLHVEMQKFKAPQSLINQGFADMLPEFLHFCINS